MCIVYSFFFKKAFLYKRLICRDIAFKKKCVNYLYIYILLKTFGNIYIFNNFERSFLCSSSLYLFDQKYRKTIIL